MISHPNVTFKSFVFTSQLSCPVMKLGLAEWWNGDVVDQGSRHPDFWRHGVRNKRVHGIISKMREHLGSFLVIRTYVTFREGVQRSEQRRSRFETSKPSSLSKVDLWAQGTSQTPQITQDRHSLWQRAGEVIGAQIKKNLGSWNHRAIHRVNYLLISWARIIGW